MGTARTQRARCALDAESSCLQGSQSWAPPAPLGHTLPGSSPSLRVLPRRDGATSWSQGDNSRNQACEKHDRKPGNPRFFPQETSFFCICSKNSFIQGLQQERVCTFLHAEAVCGGCCTETLAIWIVRNLENYENLIWSRAAYICSSLCSRHYKEDSRTHGLLPFTSPLQHFPDTS